MLALNPEQRPTAITIRDRILHALEQAGLDTLCCKSRNWDPELACTQRARLSTRRHTNTDTDGAGTSIGSVSTASSTEGGLDLVADSPNVHMKKILGEDVDLDNLNGDVVGVGGKKMRKLGLGWMRKPHAKGF